MNEYNITMFFLILTGILVIIIGYLYYTTSYSTTTSIFSQPNSESEIIKTCSGFDAMKTSRCLVTEITSIYKFNVTQTNSNFDVIKESGGNCVSYSNLYKDLAIKIGYNSTTVQYYGIIGEFEGHMNAILWNTTTYCRIDQTTYACGEVPYA